MERNNMLQILKQTDHIPLKIAEGSASSADYSAELELRRNCRDRLDAWDEATQTFVEPTFAELKERKLAEIARLRWEEETAPFLYAPKSAHFDTSERSQIKYLQSLQKSLTTDWKVEEGWVSMEQADFAGLISAYEAFVAELFLKEATLQEQVASAENTVDLESIVW